MARLMASIYDDRNPYGRYSGVARVTRLGDQWSEVAVQTWDIRVETRMDADGNFNVKAVDLVTGHTENLVWGNCGSALGRNAPKRTARGKVIEPKPPRPPRVKKPRLTAKEKRQQALIDTLFEAKLDEEAAS